MPILKNPFLHQIYPNQQPILPLSWIAFILSMMLSACTPPHDSNSGSTTQATTQTEEKTDTKTHQPDHQNTNTIQALDWSKINSNTPTIDRKQFTYTLTQDSEAVKAYARYFNITPEEAQHSLTIGTASNEVLSPLLDQLGKNYLSHQLTDGNDVKLIVHTRPNIQAGEYEYTFANDFAKGLTIKVIINNQPSQPTKQTTNKSQSKPTAKQTVK